MPSVHISQSCNPDSQTYISPPLTYIREGVRAVVGVALATPFLTYMYCHLDECPTGYLDFWLLDMRD